MSLEPRTERWNATSLLQPLSRCLAGLYVWRERQREGQFKALEWREN